jgi:hypothetical protein
MAREYARIKVSVWDDSSGFVQSLDVNAKLLYIHLISRRDLSYAGHLFVRAHRWAAACFAGDLTVCEEALAALVAERYVMIDDLTGELLIRTYIKHDGGWRNPKVRKAIESAISKIESPELSTAAANFLISVVQTEKALVDSNRIGIGSTIGSTIGLESDPNCTRYTVSSNPSSSQRAPKSAHAVPPEPGTDDWPIAQVINLIADERTRMAVPRDPAAYRRTVAGDMWEHEATAISALMHKRPDLDHQKIAAHYEVRYQETRRNQP